MKRVIKLIDDNIKKLKKEHFNIENQFETEQFSLSRDMIIENMRIVSAKINCLQKLKEEVENLEYVKKEKE